MKVGILVDDLGHNQIAYSTIGQVNTLVKTSTEDSYFIFYRNRAVEIAQVATLIDSLPSAFFFDGIVIGTSFDIAIFMKNMLSPKKKILYVSEIEWYLNPKYDFKTYSGILRSMDIVVPSIEYADAVYNISGVRPTIIRDFNIKEIVDGFR